MPVPTILLYNLNGERGRQIKLICLPLRIRARNVFPEEYGLTLSQLLNGEKPVSPGSAPFSDEMLLMADLAPSQMNRFLQAFRKKKLSPVALKAVLTATNAGWDSCKLHSELSLEHEAMLRGESAHQP